MGNSESKVDFKQVVAELASKQNRVDDTAFWEQFWSPANVGSSRDVFDMIPVNEIRTLRNKSPENLATLCYKAVQTIVQARDAMGGDHKKVINCVRLLTRILPFMFEDAEWRGYFWTSVNTDDDSSTDMPMASTLLGALSDLLFCPDFTVSSSSGKPDGENLSTIDSCQYIWEAGVGFANKPPSNPEFESNRTEILKLLLTCFSEVIYIPLTGAFLGDEMPKKETYSDPHRMRWIMRFTSAENRHVLPLFTSMLNIVCAYDPVGYGVPYNYLMSTDYREPLVQAALHVLIVCLDKDSQPANDESGYADNFFINYLSRIHREEDFEFMLKGITRLLNNPLQSTYLPNSTKKIAFHQELLILLWKCCEYNQKFMYFVLKTSDVLEILVPILYHINDSRNDQARVGLIHMGVFLVLLLSGERNFGVRLNKPYTARAAIDVQSFTGTHADLLIIVFHKLITTGNHRLQSLFDCLLTIIVNVSPYLKSISMTAANKLVHLVEAFSTSWFLFSTPTNHHLMFFLLEVFNNIIQYQFDGNSNLIYTIIRKRQVFYQLANLNTDSASIAKSLSGRKTRTTITEIADQLKSSAATSPVTPLPSTVTEPTGPVVNPTLAATPDMTGRTDFANGQDALGNGDSWSPTPEWVESWKSKLPLQTIMRLLQVLVPQVEKICIDKGLTDESEILKFLQHGTLVGLLPVPHPILIRKYQANAGTNHWFRTYMWGVIYLRNTDPPIWYDTEVNLFEIQRV